MALRGGWRAETMTGFTAIPNATGYKTISRQALRRRCDFLFLIWFGDCFSEASEFSDLLHGAALPVGEVWFIWWRGSVKRQNVAGL